MLVGKLYVGCARCVTSNQIQSRHASRRSDEWWRICHSCLMMNSRVGSVYMDGARVYGVRRHLEMWTTLCNGNQKWIYFVLHDKDCKSTRSHNLCKIFPQDPVSSMSACHYYPVPTWLFFLSPLASNRVLRGSKIEYAHCHWYCYCYCYCYCHLRCHLPSRG